MTNPKSYTTGSTSTTIASLATPPGVGGIAIIRISGSLTLFVAQKLSGNPDFTFAPRHATYTPIVSNLGEEIDIAVITYFPSPNSYTGEDVVEVSCHGGQVIAKQVLDACFSFGCVPAQPGEFTKRAFLNGKMDLCQAEAVAEVIMSSSLIGKEANYRVLSGRFSSLVSELKSSLLHLAMTLEAELNFTEEEIPTKGTDEKVAIISNVLETTNKLLSTYSTGKMLNDGALIVIVGKPNAGKSSLLNTILGEERTIVSKSPGTTRDAVEVPFLINGFLVRFVDTAGIRSETGFLEAKGVGFTHLYLDKADLILNVVDLSIYPRGLKPAFQSAKPKKTPLIHVLNKCDLVNLHQTKTLKGGVLTSALSGQGIDALLKKIHENVVGSSFLSSEIVLTNQRHWNSLRKVATSLSSLVKDLRSRVPTDVIASDLRITVSHLDELLGATTADEILDNIFANFCIGK